jgi:undecaprenyl-diphosphatase
MYTLPFLNTLAEESEVLDKYFLAAGLLLFLYFSTNSRREKRSIVGTIILSFLVARLVITPAIHFLYYQPDLSSLSQLRLLESERNDWPFPNGHAAFLLAIATTIFLYNKKWGVGLFIAVLFLNISRIVTGVHALSDMLGGMIIGVITAYIIFNFTALYSTRVTFGHRETTENSRPRAFPIRSGALVGRWPDTFPVPPETQKKSHNSGNTNIPCAQTARGVQSG